MFTYDPDRPVRETAYKNHEDNPVSQYLHIFYVDTDVIIHRYDFKYWLVKRNEWSLKSCLLANWWSASEATDTKTQKNQGERQSQLYILIWRVHQFLSQTKKPTAQQVWNEIQHSYKEHDTNEIIQEVESSKISWCSGYGNEQILQRSSFDKTLSKIRKIPPF